MSSELIRDLKNLFHTFIYYKSDDETNFHNWINDNVEYTDGGFINYSSEEQNVNVSFTAWIINPGYRRGDLNIYVTAPVPGQTVQVDFVRSSSGTISTVYLTTDSNGF